MARSVCAQLEQLGTVAKVDRSHYEAQVKPEAIADVIGDLASRVEIERRCDVRRLRALTEYAETEECRSIFLRRWFGEDNPPICGNCDICAPRETTDDDGPPARSGRGRRRRGGSQRGEKKRGGKPRPPVGADGAKKPRRRRSRRRRSTGKPRETGA